MRVRDVQHRVPVTVLEDAQIVLAVALEGVRDVWELARAVALPDAKVKTILYNYATPALEKHALLQVISQLFLQVSLY